MIAAKIFFQKYDRFPKVMSFKTVIWNCSSLIFKKKLPVACIIGRKTNKPLREALKINLDDSSESSFCKYQ